MVTLVLGYDTVYSAGTARSKIKLCGLSSWANYADSQFVPHTKHNTSPLCSQELWPLDHRGGLLSST
jgi:hypothetical protein